jgi:hypothetical protein
MTQHESRELVEMCREELERAVARITERLARLEYRPVRRDGDEFESLRRFYEDLVEKTWTEADETFLTGLDGVSEPDIRRLLRDGFRRSRISPPPSFAYLINLAKKDEGEAGAKQRLSHYQEAVPAAARERLANVLHKELEEATHEIADRLFLDEAKGEALRVQLERVEGQIISQLTPLV